MTQPSVTHATFVIDRLYEAPPARVFAAWATKEAKARWFACHGEWTTSEFTLDFRVGGQEQPLLPPAPQFEDDLLLPRLVDLRYQRSGNFRRELRDHLFEEKGVHRPPL